MKKKILVSMIAGLIMATMSISSYAMTADEVTTKNPTSYTAGTQSIYGPSLSQEQLNAVAQATADFMTNNITDNMDNDTKIKTAHDFLKNYVCYIDWNKGEGANTAYGALVRGQAACSGYARAFKALCDSMDVSCYYIHADATAENPSHQWNMVEYNDGYYFIDVEANDSSGFNAIYHSSTHPYTCDLSQLPAIGSKSGANTAGTQTVKSGWQEENGKWLYYENGAKAANKWINGLYYVGSDGAMLTNTTTPDGYKVGADGTWVQAGTQSGNIGGNDGVHTKRASDPAEWPIININMGTSVWQQYQKEMHCGVNCNILSNTVGTFSFSSETNDLDPIGHEIWVVGYIYSNGQVYALGEPLIYKFDYNKEFSLDFTKTGKTAIQLAEYCKTNDVMIDVSVVDKNAITSPNSAGWYFYYESTNSVTTTEIKNNF